MKFANAKHDIEQFAHDINIVGKMIGRSFDQVSEHFTETFLPNIESQFLEIYDIDTEF